MHEVVALENSFEQPLRAADLRVTKQRLAVLAAVRDRPHADTGTLIAAVRADLKSVSHQAVYDCLKVLTDAGLLQKIQPAGSVARYEIRRGDGHHHLVCRDCGIVVDVKGDVGSAPGLTAADAHGFDLQEAEITYWGRCPACTAAAAKTAPAP